MKKTVLALITLIIIGICIPAVAAENYNIDIIETTYYHDTCISESYSSIRPKMPINLIEISNSELIYGNEIVTSSAQIRYNYIGNYESLPQSDNTPVNIGSWATATYGYFKYTSNEIDYLQIYLTDIEYISDYPVGYSGSTVITLTTEDLNFIWPESQSVAYTVTRIPPGDIPLKIFLRTSHNDFPYAADSTYFYSFSNNWINTLNINTNDNFDNIELIRNGLNSKIDVYTETTDYSNTENVDYNINLFASTQRPYIINVTNLINNNIYTYYINNDGILVDDEAPEDPDTDKSVTIYIRNSQTGAAIANSRCVIDALVNGVYHPVVNDTEPSGIFSVTLQPTGGGLPNPDGYRLIASADGYINPLPEINFTVDEYTTSIYCYLDPIAGGPVDENNTFIDFFVRDMSANPISGATINFGGYTMITNSAGYAVLEVGKNATYTYTVSKSGYGSLTGNVVIGADPRYTINTVLAPTVIPTTPTSIPTDTPIGPTPTLTAPTGEPVSNWLEWFAAHFGMILGGGVEIGKIFMWLCFTVPVGVYVGKEAKAGAAGFMAGAGIVTLFFVLIGWVPLWLVVLLALIIGLLYAKVFNNSDNGGGR